MTDVDDARREEWRQKRLRNAKAADLERREPKYDWMRNASTYRMSVNSPIEPRALKGTIVYPSAYFDYGVTRHDERVTGRLHKSATLNSDGANPSFTVLYDDLEPTDQI